MRHVAAVLALLLAPAASAEALELRAPAGGCVATPAPAGGFATARTAQADRDWDLELLDARGRLLDRSAAVGTAQEVVQGWGARTVRACHRAGARSLDLDTALWRGPAPRDRTARLARVDVSGGRLPALEALGLDVTHDVSATHADVVLGPGEDALLRAAGLRFTTRALEPATPAPGPTALPTGRTTYRDPADFQDEMRALVAAHPGAARMVTLPRTSVQGRAIQGIEIAEDVAARDGRPVSVVVALHHAREWPSGETAMEFAHDLLGAGAREAAVRRDVRTIVIPVLNPDGFASTRTAAPADPFGRADEAGVGAAQTPPAAAGLLSYRRKSCSGDLPASAPCEAQFGVDLNRNYGLRWGGPGSSSDPTAQTHRGDGPWSEPETAAFHELTQRLPVMSLLTVHNVVGAIYEASDTGGDDPVPDAEALDALGAAMGEAAGYSHRPNDNTGGTTEDWNYFAAGTFGFTVELGPSGGSFHGPYQRSVVDQYVGNGAGGMREAFLLAAEHAADPAFHAVVDVRAAPGTVVTARRDFATPFSGGSTPDFVELSRIGPGAWHLPPSTPLLSGTPAWTITCGDVTRELELRRGDRVDLRC